MRPFIPQVIRPHLSKILNSIVIITTFLLWAKTKNNTQDVDGLKLQLQNLNNTCCSNSNQTNPALISLQIANLTEGVLGNITANVPNAIRTNFISSVYTACIIGTGNILSGLQNYVANYSDYYLGSSSLSSLPRNITNNLTDESSTTETLNSEELVTETALCSPGTCTSPIDEPEARKLSNDILNFYKNSTAKAKNLRNINDHNVVVIEDSPIPDSEKCEMVCRKLYQNP
ncbi:MAG: hypothetical protein ABSA84_03650 [Gammaproteobacteria bacterium]